MISKIQHELELSFAIKEAMSRDVELLSAIADLTTSCVDALRVGGKIIFAGNGGSFADAQHLSAEFVSRFCIDRGPLASIALGTNNSALSAMGNDYGFENVFSRELEALGRVEDIFVPITTSGNSENILRAVSTAQRLGITTFALTGGRAGRIVSMCRCLKVPSESTARIQESHITLGHIICGLIEALYFNEIAELKI